MLGFILMGCCSSLFDAFSSLLDMLFCKASALNHDFFGSFLEWPDLAKIPKCCKTV